MLRASVTLIVCLLCAVLVTGSVYSHPGSNSTVSTYADVRHIQNPGGQGVGKLEIETWVEFTFGTHTFGEPHEDAGHQLESLQNHIVYDTHGTKIFFEYFYKLQEFIGHIPGTPIRHSPDIWERSAEACFDLYGYSHGKFRWGDTKIYSLPQDTSSDRDCLLAMSQPMKSLKSYDY